VLHRSDSSDGGVLHVIINTRWLTKNDLKERHARPHDLETHLRKDLGVPMRLKNIEET
jgi:hypothetical protein